MLKTNLISKAKSLFPAVLIAGLGVLSSHQAANGATLSLVSVDPDPNAQGRDTYNYQLVVDPGEAISFFDTINISGVTAGDFFTAPSGFAGSKTNDVVQFIYIDAGDPAITIPSGTTITGFKLLGNLGSQSTNGAYQIFDNQNFNNTTSISGSGSPLLVPGTITAVPESSNALGLMLIGGIAAASGLRKQLVKS